MTETATQQVWRTLDGAAAPLEGTYVLDKAHTTVAFVARHLMVAKVRGHFEEFEGTITVGKDAGSSSIAATIQAASVDTRDETRDKHIRSADFLDVEKFPTIRFASTSVQAAGAERWKVLGDLTIRDVTRPVQLEVEWNGATRDPWGGVRFGFSATTEIDRDEFGVSFNAALETGGFVVAKQVKIEIDGEATLQA
jgi:polyisoprenoid-binding protein YceI